MLRGKAFANCGDMVLTGCLKNIFHDLAEKGSGHFVKLSRDQFEFTHSILQRNGNDVPAFKRNHVTPLLLLEEVIGSKACLLYTSMSGNFSHFISKPNEFTVIDSFYPKLHSARTAAIGELLSLIHI